MPDRGGQLINMWPVFRAGQHLISQLVPGPKYRTTWLTAHLEVCIKLFSKLPLLYTLHLLSKHL